MSGALWAGVLTGGIAVVGTLAGGLVTWWGQARQARVTRAESRRADALDAVAALLAAVADHRRARWVREELRLSGADAADLVKAREKTHVTRSAITGPLAVVCILLPTLADQAEATVQAAYTMRNAPDLEALEAMRAASVAAEKQLRQAASRVFAPDHGHGGA